MAKSSEMRNLQLAILLKKNAAAMTFARQWAAARAVPTPAVICDDDTGEIVRSAQSAYRSGVTMVAVLPGPFPGLWPLDAPAPFSAVIARVHHIDLPHMQAPLPTALAAALANDAHGPADPGIAARIRALRLTPFVPVAATPPIPLDDVLGTATDPAATVAVILDGPAAGKRLARVRADNPDARILAVGIAADGALGGAVDIALPQGVTAIDRPVDTWALLDAVSSLHLGAHPVGLTALFAGRDVVTDAVPFYAGYGLTTDLATAPWDGIEAGLDTLATALFEDLSIYRSPYDGTPLSFHEAADLYRFFLDRRAENDRPAICVGVKWWNHRTMAALLASPAGKTRFIDDFDTALKAAKETGARICFWAAQMTEERAGACEAAGIPHVRLEDGFLRSVGLGAALAKGASVAFDRRGIYFDASRPSDLEWMIEHVDLGKDDIDRARRLREAIVAARLTKYNVGKASDAPAFPAGRTGILVPGQVADDAGILKTLSTTIDVSGSPEAENVNLQLLKAARARNPDAFIVFKPHPDVEADLRKGKVPRDIAAHYADAVVTDIDIVDLLEQCDRVETISSLSGFEALMRGKPATVHGMPFYAGWGLSDDLASSPRRTRTRTLDELVHFALVAYARYIDPLTLLPCPPEVLVTRLTSLRGDRRHAATYAVAKFISWFGRKIGL